MCDLQRTDCETYYGRLFVQSYLSILFYSSPMLRDNQEEIFNVKKIMDNRVCLQMIKFRKNNKSPFQNEKKTSFNNQR